MTFLGFVVFGGTLKKGSLSAIRSLLAASHHVVMITGGQLPNYPMLINTMCCCLEDCFAVTRLLVSSCHVPGDAALTACEVAQQVTIVAAPAAILQYREETEDLAWEMPDRTHQLLDLAALPHVPLCLEGSALSHLHDDELLVLMKRVKVRRVDILLRPPCCH